ncbi:MAG: TonB-dependent receptor, partial [Acidobacteriia bacterium]|nr:TonB-dependent receptor [Terriglobia bacterium]
MLRPVTASLLAAILFSLPLWSQTSATGALSGTVTDAQGGALPGVTVGLLQQETGAQRTAMTDTDGVFRFALLSPGKYSVEFSITGFKTVKRTDVTVNVSETAVVNTSLQIGMKSEIVLVKADQVQVQTETSSLGQLIGENDLRDIPLTNRNYTQMLHLSAGVTASLINAAEVGRNTQDVYVHGGTTLDNNYQMDGAQINSSYSGRAGDTSAFGGIPVPNPDAIQEFNIQTGQYDAGSGRSMGANVNVVTKSGGNDFHGGVFEYFRNDVLNANDYFLNRNGQPRPAMKQNQFGFTLGGPVKHNKLFFFGSYQGTRQVNGMGASSLRSVNLPPLTNDRSAAALGAIFAGQRGLLQMMFGGVGPAILADGSNINPVALTLLQFKLPDGSYYIPTPQIIINGLGMSTYSVPSHFSENQMIENVDYKISAKHTFSAHWFSGWDDDELGFPQSSLVQNVNAVPGNGPLGAFRNHTLTAKLTSILTSNFVNEGRFSFIRNVGVTQGGAPLSAQQAGIQPGPMSTEMPSIVMPGLFSLGADVNDGEKTAAESFQLADQIAWSKGKQNIRAGLGFERIRQNDNADGVERGVVILPSFPDFLLGLPGCPPGTFPVTCNPFNPGSTTGIPFSNLLVSVGFSGVVARHRRMNDWSMFFQDDYKLHRQLTLNVGLRWEVNGPASETNGLITNFNPALADPVPPPGGTFSGFVVPSNFPGTLPTGVTRSDNKSTLAGGTPLHNFAPRIGLAWRPLAGNQNFVVHSGYGIFYSRTSTMGIFGTSLAQPYFVLSQLSGPANTLASLQQPFNPAPPPASAFPIWTPRQVGSNMSTVLLAPNFDSPMAQQWSLNLEYELKGGVMAKLGYVGSHGTRLLEMAELNQAQLASPQNPIHGETTNTVLNVGMRVPIVGFTPDGLRATETGGMSSYHGLEATVRKRLSHGLQLQASYTFSKTLDNEVTLQSSGGVLYGGQTQTTVGNGRGVAEFSRPQRLVLSYLYSFSNFRAGAGLWGRL